MGALHDAWEAGRAAWPGVALSEDEFTRWVATRCADETAIEKLNTRDLYLTCACFRGDRAALDVFDTRFASTIDAALASLRMRDEHGDEIRQRLRAKLFAGEQARIAAYRGVGELGGWLRVAVIREALDLRRASRREIPVEDPLVELEAVPLADPTLAALKAQYREPMRAAFKAAITALPATDRTLLRYKYVDGATLDEIAAIVGAHRATVARRLRDIRDELAESTRNKLMTAIGVGVTDADSIIRLVHSQLDVSLSGLK